MGRAAAWFVGNDMRVRLDKLQSSTMGSTSYLNSSTGVTVDVWQDDTTSSTANKVVSAQNLPYVSGSNGRYDAIIQSSGHSMTQGSVGMAVVTLNHSGLNGQWRPKFRVDYRRTS